MNDMSPKVPPSERKEPRDSAGAMIAYVALPLLLLGLVATWLVLNDPMRVFTTAAPPVERLTFERRILDDEGIHLKVRAGGSESVVIAQVQVDDAYWRFRQVPDGALPNLSSAWLHVPYPWLQGNAHVVKVVTKTGATFEHEIEVAVASPKGQVGGFWIQTIVGSFVGILPVAIGLMFFPLLRNLPREGMLFILALTCGLLAFLFVDMIEDALELGAKAAPSFQGPLLVVIVAVTSCLALLSVGRRKGTPRGLALATYIALGIGLHNFGEGLAIGAALVAGVAGLGAFLVLGFAIHNVTEGIGIAAPLLDGIRPPLKTFAGLTLLAGAPAIAGIWLGSFAIAPHWAALALALGAGAIFQVLFEVGAYAFRSSAGSNAAFHPLALSGFAVGVAFMYLTGMAIKI